MKMDIKFLQIIFAEIIIESDVTVPDGELVDGVDVSELALSAIRLDEEFEFDGKIRTTDTITFLGDLDLVGTCEGEDLSAWAKKVVRINVEQVSENSAWLWYEVDWR